MDTGTVVKAVVVILLGAAYLWTNSKRYKD
jgi:hypothetical protein